MDVAPEKVEQMKGWCKERGMVGEDYAGFWDAIQAAMAGQRRKQILGECCLP